nr:hypothetical protein [Tanacetum cinerariifolium]
MSSFDQRNCFHCGSLIYGLRCHKCICDQSGNNLRNGYCSLCDFGAGISFVYSPNSFNNSKKNFDHPPQPMPPIYDDYDYKESTIPLNDIISQEPPSNVITTSLPVLPIKDPKVSLIMGNEEINTIPEKESDEFIKSSAEDLIPILSESEDTSESESVCILPSCDDFSPIDIPEEESVTFSNPLFNSNDDFTSSDDESLSDENVLEDNVKIYSNPLFKFDDEYISSDVNPLFNEVLKNIESKDSYDSNLDESDLLVTPLSDAYKDECFDSGGDVDGINHFEDGYYDSEGDILYLECLLSDDTTPNLPPEVLLDRDLRSLSDAPINNLMSKDKIFDPGIHDQNFYPTYVSFTFEDRHYLFFTYVV